MQSKNKNKNFVIAITILECVLVIVYGGLIDPVNADGLSFATAIDILFTFVATLGFLYINNHTRGNYGNVVGSWFVIVIITIQTYFLFAYFWASVYLRQINTLQYSSSVIAAACEPIMMLVIVYSNLKGFVRFIQIFSICLIGLVGYSCNEMIINESLKGLDYGGGLKTFFFGAVYGLCIRLVGIPVRSFSINNKSSPISINMAIYSLLFTLIYLPFFVGSANLGGLAYVNVFFCMLASIITASLCHIVKQKKILFQVLLECSIAAAVLISTSACIVQNLAQPMVIGGFVGFVYTIYGPDLKAFIKTFNIPDPSLNIKLFLIPGFFSGILASINIIAYESSRTNKIVNFPFPQILNHPVRTAGIEIAIVVITTLMAIVTGVATGLLIKYTSSNNELENDDYIWNEAEQENRSEMEDKQQRLIPDETINKPAQFIKKIQQKISSQAQRVQPRVQPQVQPYVEPQEP